MSKNISIRYIINITSTYIHLPVMALISYYRYQKGTIPGSLSCPCQNPSQLDQSTLLSKVKDFLDTYRYQVKVVVDTNNAHCGQVIASTTCVLFWLPDVI